MRKIRALSVNGDGSFFLDFLRSGEMDIDAFIKCGAKIVR